MVKKLGRVDRIRGAKDRQRLRKERVVIDKAYLRTIRKSGEWARLLSVYGNGKGAKRRAHLWDKQMPKTSQAAFGIELTANVMFFVGRDINNLRTRLGVYRFSPGYKPSSMMEEGISYREINLEQARKEAIALSVVTKEQFQSERWSSGASERAEKESLRTEIIRKLTPSGVQRIKLDVLAEVLDLLSS